MKEICTTANIMGGVSYDSFNAALKPNEKFHLYSGYWIAYQGNNEFSQNGSPYEKIDSNEEMHCIQTLTFSSGLKDMYLYTLSINNNELNIRGFKRLF